MATAIEYGLIAAGISVTIITVVTGLGKPLRGEISDINEATKACAIRPIGTTNVVIKDWRRQNVEYKCPTLSWIFNPTFVGFK